jgi:hypothetical protein
MENAKSRGGGAVEVEVGRVTKIGDGPSRDVFGAEVSFRPDPEGLSHASHSSWRRLMTAGRAASGSVPSPAGNVGSQMIVKGGGVHAGEARGTLRRRRWR